MNRASLIVAGAVLAAAGGWARADMAAPPSLAERVALADAVVVGKVTGFGDKLVSGVRPFGAPGEKVDYQVAILQVSDALLGPRTPRRSRSASSRRRTPR